MLVEKNSSQHQSKNSLDHRHMKKILKEKILININET